MILLAIALSIHPQVGKGADGVEPTYTVEPMTQQVPHCPKSFPILMQYNHGNMEAGSGAVIPEDIGGWREVPQPNPDARGGEYRCFKGEPSKVVSIPPTTILKPSTGDKEASDANVLLTRCSGPGPGCTVAPRSPTIFPFNPVIGELAAFVWDGKKWIRIESAERLTGNSIFPMSEMRPVPIVDTYVKNITIMGYGCDDVDRPCRVTMPKGTVCASDGDNMVCQMPKKP
jgi:hypothetical protein